MLKIKAVNPCVFMPLFISLLVGVVSCNKDGPAIKPDDVDYYTCTMHPSVRSQDPHGKCPICSMDLVPVLKKGVPNTNATNTAGRATVSGDDKPGEFTVPVERQQQIGVTHAIIQKQPFTHTVRAVGVVAYDKQRHWDYVMPSEGYVKKLSVFSRGELVGKDAPLLTVYSTDLLATQSEFVDLLKSRDEAQTRGSRALLETRERLVESARQRLRLWNITDDQIAELENTRRPSEILTLRSPFNGVVEDIGVDQGRRVMAGDRLVDIIDLSTVWVLGAILSGLNCPC